MARKKPKKDSRRARGTGSVFFHGERKVWVGRVPTGRTAAGRPVYRQVSAGTQAECVAKMKAAAPAKDGLTVARWGEAWLAGLAVRGSTAENYARAVRLHILPALGHLAVRDVTRTQVAAALKKMQPALAPGTVGLVRDVGRAMFAAAVHDELATRNPFAQARRPKVEKKPITPFTAAELKAVVADVADLSAGPMLTLLATTGMRLGEASALDVTDWDPAAGTVVIAKTYSKAFGTGPPKSKHSRRTITVPDAARPSLRTAAGDRNNGPLFLTGHGKRFIKSLVQRAFARCLARLGLPRRKLHTLRHSVATHLVAANVPLADAAKYLGDSLAVFIKTYVHPGGHDPVTDLNKVFA